jgi:hypothetical protein
MDVNLTQNTAQFNQFAVQNQNGYAAYSKNAQNTSSSTANVGNAYEVAISDAAKEAQAAAKTAVTSTEETATEVKTKGLDTDTIQAMKDSIKVNEETMINIMIQAMSDSNNKLQGWLDNGTGILNFGGVKIDAAKFALPEVATNPADAKKAVSEGGAWSVDSVATRLFDLASTIAGNDPEKLQEMRAAVEEGFAQAGQVWQGATGTAQMPDITQQTYNELMHRFDARMQELAGAAAVATA